MFFKTQCNDPTQKSMQTGVCVCTDLPLFYLYCIFSKIYPQPIYHFNHLIKAFKTARV